MVQQVTKGIKISVNTNFEGSFYKQYQLNYAFAYQVVIENQSKDLVQLYAREWTIFDALKPVEMVVGPGVIGEKPILKPGEIYSYTSGCALVAPFGLMRGFYSMRNLETNQTFKVAIPSFRLHASFALN
ncbi:Co2+/Mg2+ efflux protein ApaG [Bizionia sediminis]|uniref:Co2+/Mg2+ efflux protein ApaG n=1 Tax=Bizionia sediminis TaxID=1737064 RepID=A0ABW5KUE1_9FLAO